jgi:UDP-N-acetylmuramoylalanine--D-glutamate ligase
MMKKNWSGKRVIVMGAARQGLALTRYLVSKGAGVTLTDNRSEDQLCAAIQSLEDIQVKWALGGHPFELLEQADLVCLSGGIPLTIPFVIEAKNRKIPLSNDSQIFMEACPCRVIGITGSAGKTTTTALVGEMAKAHNTLKSTGRTAWVGGNIGNPLINQVDQMHEDDLVILELSSFQLEMMKSSPHVAAVLNISPNHLDRHGTMEAYRNAKVHILTHQHKDDVAVLNREDEGSWDLLDNVRSNLITFGIKPPASHLDGTFVKNDLIYLQIMGDHLKLLPTEWIQLRGEHNLYNVLAACAIATGASIALPAIQTAIEEFPGIPHRLEFVRSFKGADWYNDSIATAPERSMAAIRSFDQPIVLLLGGRDKNLPWNDLISLVKERVNHLIVFGEATGKIMETLGTPLPGEKPYSITYCDGLKKAVLTAADLVNPGDVVLLSPGGTSFDEFFDFEERGEMFQKWVKELL